MKSMELCTSLGQREYKIFTEYIFNTILPHFKLIRLVFTTARKEQIPHVSLTVDPPFEPGVLKQSKGINVWEYEKRIEELDKKAAEKTNEKLVEKGKQKAEMEAKATETLSTAVKDKPMDKDVSNKGQTKWLTDKLFLCLGTSGGRLMPIYCCCVHCLAVHVIMFETNFSELSLRGLFKYECK